MRRRQRVAAGVQVSIIDLTRLENFLSAKYVTLATSLGQARALLARLKQRWISSLESLWIPRAASNVIQRVLSPKDRPPMPYAAVIIDELAELTDNDAQEGSSASSAVPAAGISDDLRHKNPVLHRLRQVRTPRPILRALCAFGCATL